MHRHTLDPLSAALGILAVAVGALVAAAKIDDLGSDTGAWIAAGVFIGALGLIPRSRRQKATELPDDPAPPV